MTATPELMQHVSTAAPAAVHDDDSLRDNARAAKRTSLMLRSAKVLCQTGEYVCVVRDVCEIATSLSFLHDLPPQLRILLCLANGTTYPIERVWSGKRQAGYRFAADISLGDFMHETTPFAARPTRLAIRADALLIDGRKSHRARLLDISTHGAKFDCHSDLRQRGLIGFQVSGLNPRLGQIAWCDQSGDVPRFGLHFQHPIALRELAQAAMQLQPFGAPAPGSFSETLGNARAA